jgi:hypothetical protein
MQMHGVTAHVNAPLEQGVGKYHCTADLLFDWVGIGCMTPNNFCFYMQNRPIQTSQIGGQWYSDTSPFSIPCLEARKAAVAMPKSAHLKTAESNAKLIKVRQHAKVEKEGAKTFRLPDISSNNKEVYNVRK